MTAASAKPIEGSPAQYWDALLRPLLEKTPQLADDFMDQLRSAKLTFGDRVHCPFLRPFFLSPEDEKRVRPVAETIAELAERVTLAALRSEERRVGKES